MLLEPSGVYNINSEKIIQNKKGGFEKFQLWLDFPQTGLVL
jgi:hypothetical protein